MFEIIKPIKEQWIITANFKEQLFYGEHNGIDIKTKCEKYPNGIGMPIYACADGIWKKSKYDKKAGNIVILKHKDGWESRYYHLSKSNFNKGWTKIKQGDCIGYSGNTGKYCKGAHLHFEIRHDNEPFNPLILLSENNIKSQIIIKIGELTDLVKKL